MPINDIIVQTMKVNNVKLVWLIIYYAALCGILCIIATPINDIINDIIVQTMKVNNLKLVWLIIYYAAL